VSKSVPMMIILSQLSRFPRQKSFPVMFKSSLDFHSVNLSINPVLFRKSHETSFSIDYPYFTLSNHRFFITLTSKWIILFTGKLLISILKIFIYLLFSLAKSTECRCQNSQNLFYIIMELIKRTR